MATKKKPNRKPAKQRAKPAPAVKAKSKKSSKSAKAKARAAKPAARKAVARKSVKRPAVKRRAVKKPAVKKPAVKKAAAKPAVKRAAKAPAAVTVAAVGLELPPEVLNLALVLDALNAETGSNGGDAAKDRVQLFRDTRGDVDARTFGFVSSLPIRNWYVSPDKPNDEERRSLWFKVRELMNRPQVPNPGGWDGASPTDDLRLIAQRTAP